MFTKSLQDVVKGIRAHKRNVAPYISNVISEAKAELNNMDDDSKANAIEKLSYLRLEGYDMSWANFKIVEVMSMPWFGHRHIGYLAAAQSFTPDTDVILLTTHLFRKAFSPTSNELSVMYETGASISCLANICNKDLAMALLKDIYGMLNSARPYTRKKAVLVLYKLFQCWPKALRLSFPRLREKLNDDDPSVRSAAVYVVCELARNNPKNYLSLAPEFFKILTTSSNNWILIKIVKLLGSLVPLEPRLAKKLRDPLHDIITTTPAKSLLYECINTLISGKITSKSVVSLCMEKLRTFIEDPDQNLKYLGLLGLHKLMKQHLRVVAEHKDLVLDCLEDEDSTIRRRAIDIITCMVSRKNMSGIVRRLLEHLNSAEGDYRNYVMSRIIKICSQENFSFISDFAWYVETLLTLTVMVGIDEDNAVALRSQFIDILVRVKGVRRFALKRLTALLSDKETAMSGALTNTALPQVLFAAAWAVGEYPDLVADPMELLKTILDPSISRLTPNTQIVYLHAALKICAYVLKRLLQDSSEKDDAMPTVAAAPAKPAVVDVMGLLSDNNTGSGDVKDDSNDDEDISINVEIKAKTEDEKSPAKIKIKAEGGWRSVAQEIMDVLTTKLSAFIRSSNVEVQERAVCYHRFIQTLAGEEEKGVGLDDVQIELQGLPKSQAEAVIGQFVDFFGGNGEKLGLVHPKAQKRVKVPAGLDLNKWIHEPDSDSDDSDEDEKGYGNWDDDLEDFLSPKKKKKSKNRSKKDDAREEREREEYMRNLQAKRERDPFYLKDSSNAETSRADVDDIPIKDLRDLDLDVGKKKKRSKKNKRKHKESDDLPQSYEVAAGPMLDGGDDTDEETGKGGGLDIDITSPLQADEVMPQAEAYGRGRDGEENNSRGKKSKREKKKKKDKKKKKGKSREKPPNSDGEAKSAKPKEEKSAKVANLLDLGNSPATRPVVAPVQASGDDDEYELEIPDVPPAAGKKKKKKKDKEKRKRKEKTKKHEKKSEPASTKKTTGPVLMDLLGDVSSTPSRSEVKSNDNSIPQSLFASSSTTFRKQLLYRDNALCVYFTTRAERHQPYSLFVDIHLASLTPRLDVARIELANSFEGSSEKPNPSPPIFNVNGLKQGKPKGTMMTIEWKTFDGPRVIPATVYYQIPGSSQTIRQMCELRLGCSSFCMPAKISMNDLAGMIRDQKTFTHSSATKLTLTGMSMQDGLRAISGMLNVELVKAVAGAATYYGRSNRSPCHHVTVYVKAKKGDKTRLSVDVKASHPWLPQALTKELNHAMKNLPTMP